MPPAIAADPVLKRFRAALDAIYGVATAWTCDSGE
jgi:hypothetical protein